MNNWQEAYIEKYYRQLPRWQDPWAQWHDLLINNIPQNARVLDNGAGPSNRSSRYLSTMADHLIGVDVDPDVKQNEWLDEAYIYDGHKLPFPNSYFDVVVSNWVNEHIKDPIELCREIHRVLVPGGIYIFRTPNLYHYVAMTAHITPHWFHKLVANRLRNKPTDFHDPYPTYYRFNTRRKCHSILNKCEFEVEYFTITEPYPHYGLASRILFFTFMVYERIVNMSPYLENFRSVIQCVARKPEKLT